MSKKWWLISFVIVATAIVVFICGIKLADTDSFLKGFLSSLSASMVILAIGILLIDGSVMTRKRRLEKVINTVARSIAQTNEEIAVILVREMGQYLTSILNLDINLYDEKRGDWDSYKSLLRQCFQAARQFSSGCYITPASLNEQEYLNYISTVKSYIKRIRHALGSDWEVHAELLEIVKCLNKLATLIDRANYPSTVQDVINRCRILGEIGELLIDMAESTPKIKKES